MKTPDTERPCFAGLVRPAAGAVVAAGLALAATAPAMADDGWRGWDGHRHHSRHHGGGYVYFNSGGYYYPQTYYYPPPAYYYQPAPVYAPPPPPVYYAPPPPVYYAPAPVYAAPWLSVVIPLKF